MRADRLQDGIYFRSGQRPPPCFLLLLLDFAPRTEPQVASEALALVLGTLGDLQAGTTRDLPGGSPKERAKAAAEFRGLGCLLAFGAWLFADAQHDPPLVIAAKPDYLALLEDDHDPLPAVPWSAPREPSGESDVTIQLTGHSQAAVNRAAVEVWKTISDEKLPLRIVGSFAGFSRRDGRGWLDFHDGVSNIESSERLVAIEARQPAWMEGGTYMAFLRFAVDLAAWRALSRAEQELIVGRDKLTGRPLIGVERGGAVEPVPIVETGPAAEEGARPGADFREPPEVTDPLVKASHLQRASRNRASPWAPAAQRIFRQGYEFLETLDDRGPRLGLNFVSFQGDLGRLRRVLHLPGWLGDVNFGGPARTSDGSSTLQLVTLRAGGFYCVPPQGSPFPGAQLFADAAASRPGRAL